MILTLAGARAGRTPRLFLLAAIPALVAAQLCSIGYNEFAVSAGVEEGLGIVEECFEMLAGALLVGAAVGELVPRLVLERADRTARRSG